MTARRSAGRTRQAPPAGRRLPRHAAHRPPRPWPGYPRLAARRCRFRESASSVAGRSIAAIARAPAYPRRTARGWPALPGRGCFRSTSRGHATHARSATTGRPAHRPVDPSGADLGLLPGQRSAGGVSLLLPRLGDQFPEPGLQGRPAIGVAQATARDLLGLSRIALGQAHLGQAIEHLRLARSDALGSLEAGGGAVQVAAALLLLGGCEHRQDRPVQLLVGRQAAGRAGGRNAGGRGTTGAAGRHVVAAAQRWRGGAAGRSLVLGAGAERSAADRRGAGLRRESLDRCGIGALRHHHHHAGVAALGNALGGGALLGTRYLGTGDAETAAFLVGHRSTGIHHRDRPVLRAGAARDHGTAGKRGEYENLLHVRSSRINSASLVPSPSPRRRGSGSRSLGPGRARCHEYRASVRHSGNPPPSPARSARRPRPSPRSPASAFPAIADAPCA